MNKSIINTNSKPCKICHIIKPLTEFYKDSQLKSKISNRCKACVKIKNARRTKKQSGFTQEDATEVPLSPEEKFMDSYANSDVKVKGKLVMKKGKILDDKWYQRKLRQLRKGRKG